MPSERVQRTIDQVLDEAERAAAAGDWAAVRTLCQRILTLDPDNEDARSFLAGAERGLTTAGQNEPVQGGRERVAAVAPAPSSFASGRYVVKKFLGEGGKKKVYLAHDTLLDRDVAFALIKMEGLDEAGRDRIKREAQAMGRLGTHPHVVSVFDMGEEPVPGPHPGPLPRLGEGARATQPYIVTELMAGGDVEGLIEKAPDHRPPLERTLAIATAVCDGLAFAHEHGIVHRDLKPGNVWLTPPTGNWQPATGGVAGTAAGSLLPAAAPVAKLGDFGLAVALDRSRLTQAGMMVGTVSYMPPEQATGGEVTPRSDLYSLGAMLYEMVTGRPPFVGDESVAIIGQHLNTPPVAPSWHNPTVPVGLEALILRLLEKDPSKRPASAGEVQAALESVAEHLSSRPPSPRGKEESSSPPLAGEGLGERSDNPLYRRVFVGREQEVRQLQSAFDAALSGKGALAMVVGEPGIGKTALCEQLATYVTLRGGTTLTGHCYEEGSLSLPYLAFVEALRSYVQNRPPEALRKELGTAATDVARIVSEVRERLSIEPRPPGDPEEDRWRLLQAVSGFLRNASAVQPLLIVLEDLHWADRGTLDLLLHLARNLQGARLLVIGTYRDVEVDRGHPLSATLAELRRSAEFRRVLLRGLGTPEVQRMLAAITGAELPGSLAESIHRQTEGNPLFVQEVVRYLVEEGHLGHGGLAHSSTPVTMSIPEGLRDVIGKRLSRLSPDCNRVLAVAAVIGRDFGLGILQAIAGLEEETLVSALEDAVQVGVLEESASGRPGGIIRYRFAHAFFRQTLYEELSAPRRLRFHQEVARALELQYATRLEEHAAELAEHFAQSTDRDDLAKAVRYGELAAQRALAVYAYGEAARHLEQALDVQEVLDPHDKAKRCHLLLALGEALLSAGEPGRVIETVAPEALLLAESVADNERASRACQETIEALLRQRGAMGFRTSVYRKWAEAADRYAASDSADRVRADSAMAAAAFFDDRPAAGWNLLQGALTLARRLADTEALYQAALYVVLLSWRPQDQEVRLSVARELFLSPSRGASAATIGRFLFGCFGVFLGWGYREQAEAALQQMKDIGDRTRDITASLQSLGAEITLKVVDGELEEAVAAHKALRERADDLGVPGIAGDWTATSISWALIHLGRPQDLLVLLQRITARADDTNLTLRPTSTQAVLCLAQMNQEEEARQLLDRLRHHWAEASPTAEAMTGLLFGLAAAILLQDRELAKQLKAGLSGAASLIHDRYPTVIARHLASAAAFLGETEEAAAYYDQALVVAGRVGFRPEIALTRLGLAELLLEDADKARRLEALGHLDFAIAEFRDMKMQPSLERALRHKDVLKA